MNKKFFAGLVASMAVVMLVAPAAKQVLAESGSDDQDGGSMMEKNVPSKVKDMMEGGMMGEKNGSQPAFAIQPSGEVMIRNAKVTASGANSVTVSVFGFSVPVTITASTKVMAGASSTTVAVGSTVDIQGSIDQSSGVITAKMVRDIAGTNSAIDALKAQIKALMDKLQQLRGGKSGQ